MENEKSCGRRGFVSVGQACRKLPVKLNEGDANED
jgi:hypothetical protein